jgi:putative oxidoreductase
MKIATLIARILLGLAFLVFGLNGFLNFIPQQPMPDGLAKQFLVALVASHYVLFVSAIEVISAILFLINRYVPLALTLLGPIVVNILLFHAFLAPSMILPGVLVAIFWFVVFYSHRSAFAGIFQSKVEG